MRETANKLDFKKVVTYMISLMKRGYHGRLVISFFGGKVTKLRLEESVDMEQFEQGASNV